MVVVVDIDPHKVQELSTGITPVSEPELDTILKDQVAAGRLLPTT